MLSVALEGPETVHCNTGPVAIQVTITGGTADSVELLKDGQAVARIEAPYQHSFDCAAEAERSYVLTAKANLRGHSFVSPPKQVVVDRTKPSVTGPFAANEVEIAKDAPIRVMFSEPMRTDLVKATSVSLVSATKTLSWSEDKKVLTVTPQEPINAPQSFVLMLHREDFQDLAGNPLPADAVTQWSWTIPAFLHTWTLPKYGNGLSALEPPAFARDRSGRFVVAWFEYTQASGAADVYVHRSGASGSTQLGGPLSAVADSGSWVQQVAVAVDSADRPVVAWIEKTPGDAQVFVRRWNGTSWEALGSLPNPITWSDALDLTLATGSSDLPAVAWREVDASQNSRVYVYRWDGTRWDPVSSPIQARTSNAIVSYPSLVIDGENRPVIAVTEASTDAAFAEAAVVWRLNGAVWEQVGSEIRPSPASETSYVNRTSLSLDVHGRPALAFEFFTPGGNFSADVYFSRFGDTGWSNPQWMGGPDARWPSLGFDAEGVPWVAWQNEPPAGNKSAQVRKAEGLPRSASLEGAVRPVFAHGGVGAPIFLVVNEQQRVAQVVTRQ